MQLITVSLALLVLVNVTDRDEITSGIQVTDVYSENSGILNNFLAEEWHFESQRNEIAPLYFLNNDLIYRNKPTLTLSGGGKRYVNGNWSNIKEVDSDQYYRFKASFKTYQVEYPARSILAHVIWLDENNNQIGVKEFPPTLRNQTPEGWNIIEQILKPPQHAHKAKLELVYRWDADGIVHFGDVSFLESPEPLPRVVRVATAHHRPRGSRDSRDNLEQFTELIEIAGARGADIITLPEAITMVGTGHNYLSAAESVPGPTTRFLGETAKKHNMYIVAGILEKEGAVVYNTAVLIDRNGELAGTYRKVSLPREEISGGITPGEEIPVFDTDFGRIGIMICWDVTFPEVARSLALQGAELIFMPIWGGDLTLTQAKAIENQVYLVTSTYNMKSAIFDLEGQIIEEATESNPVVVSGIDLNEQKLWPWLGNFKNRIPREIPLIK